MMRSLVVGLIAAAGCTPRPARSTDVPRGDALRVGVALRPNVDAARELDQAGVRSFREGHFADAARYFRAARELGGPSSELWNIARCKERVDDGQGATTALEEYLAQPNLSPRDRAEAEREAQALRGRLSILTVTTTPTGATLSLDGKPTNAQTPLSVDVAPGTHAIVVTREGYAVEKVSVDASFGRAIIVSLDLARLAK